MSNDDTNPQADVDTDVDLLETTDNTDTFAGLHKDAQTGTDMDEETLPQDLEDDEDGDNPLDTDSGMEDVDQPTQNSQPRDLNEELETDLDEDDGVEVA